MIPSTVFPLLDSKTNWKSPELSYLYMQFPMKKTRSSAAKKEYQTPPKEIPSSENTSKTHKTARKSPFIIAMANTYKKKYFKSLSGRYHAANVTSTETLSNTRSENTTHNSRAWKDKLKQGMANYLSVMCSNKYKVHSLNYYIVHCDERQ